MAGKGVRGESAAGGLGGCASSTWRAVCAFVCDGLVRGGVDPARARALRLAPTPANDQNQIEEVEEFVVEDADSLASIFAERIGELMRRYQDGHEPDFASASLAELLAWCLARAQ